MIISNLLFAKINYDLFVEYTTSNSKKRALFGLQYIKYFYVIYIFAVDFFVFLFILISNNNRKVTTFSLLLLILSSVLIFIEPWKWFI